MTHRKTLRWAAIGLAAVLALAATAEAGKTVLRLRVDGAMTEAPSDAAGLMALLQEQQTNTLQNWVSTVRAAAADSNIAGLVLIIESPAVGLAQAEDMIDAVRAFKDAGKPVFTYLDAGSNLTYLLAAAAGGHISLAEYSELDIVGLQAELSYYKGLMDKLGVEMDMVHAGAYKSALEPFVRTEPSPEAAENVNWLLDGLFGRWLELMAKGRGMPVDELKRAVDQAPVSAAKAQELKLVDAVEPFEDFAQRVRKEFGEDAEFVHEYDESPAEEIDFENPFAVFQFFGKLMEGAQPKTDPGLGLVFVEGAIMVGPSDDDPFSGTTAGSTTIRAALEAARKDDKIKAVVLRVDSPGGSALASDIIWTAAARLAKEKPLIVSMGSVAASGGYYVSLPGDVVFAQPSTITGSIGVIGGKMVLHGLMEDKLGITTTTFSRGAHSGLMTSTRKWNESERQWIEKFIDETYSQFKGRVKSSRGDKLKGDLDEMAGGRVYTGQQALELGLVDRLGGLADAMSLARSKAGLSADDPVYVLPKPSDFAELVSVLKALEGGDQHDEFEIRVRTVLGQSLGGSALFQTLQLLAPDQVRSLQHHLQTLRVLSRESAACILPAVPTIR